MATKKSKKSQYVNNGDLVDLISLFRSEPNDEVVKDELAKAFLCMAEEIFKWQKIRLLDQSDAVNNAAWTCMLKAGGQFDLSRQSAFPYFTTVIINHYRQMLRAQQSYHRTLGEYAKEEARKHGINITEEDEEKKR